MKVHNMFSNGRQRGFAVEAVIRIHSCLSMVGQVNDIHTSRHHRQKLILQSRHRIQILQVGSICYEVGYLFRPDLYTAQTLLDILRA